ncbi:STAS domain-containing protein [Methanofollis ethanolicus]|uniref:STAS domain-containing protein n=1 Tax=Methanofollis ethanolicus TaxID=488124 RepID=UPI00083104DD|nr:STAS domain-containing protein [Methanofollis ethanolicus]
MNTEEIAVSERSEGQAVVVSLQGRLDAVSSSAAAEALAAVTVRHPPAVVLDLGGLTYTSSSGLRVMLTALKEMRKGGGDLSIAGPQPRVRDVLVTAGFDRIIPIHPDVGEAVQAAEKR